MTDLHEQLIQAADALHERCVAEEKMTKSPQWIELGVVLDRIRPLSFWRNTGMPRIKDVELPLEGVS